MPRVDAVCRERGHCPSNGSRVLETGFGNYLGDIPDAHAISTLRRPAAAPIRQARLAQAQSDTKHADIREMLHGAAPGQHARTAPSHSADLVGRRDCALILIGFAGALPTPSAAALRRSCLRLMPQDMAPRITWSESDKDGMKIGVTHSRSERTSSVTHLRR